MRDRRNSDMARLHMKLQTEQTSRVFARLADAFRLNEHVEDAIELCQRGLKFHPDYVSGHIVLGHCYMDLGNLEAAREAFLRALALDEENILVLKNLGDILFQQGDLEEAARRYRRVLMLDPRNAEIREVIRGLEIKLQEGSDQEDEGAPPDQPEPPAVTEVPIFGSHSMDPEEAREWLLMDENREGAGSEVQLSPEEAELLRDEDQEDEGAGSLPRGMATGTLAEIYFQQGLLDKAIETYQKVLRHDSEDQAVNGRLEELKALRSARSKAQDGSPEAPPAGGEADQPDPRDEIQEGL